MEGALLAVEDLLLGVEGFLAFVARAPYSSLALLWSGRGSGLDCGAIALQVATCSETGLQVLFCRDRHPGKPPALFPVSRPRSAGVLRSRGRDISSQGGARRLILSRAQGRCRNAGSGRGSVFYVATA